MTSSATTSVVVVDRRRARRARRRRPRCGRRGGSSSAWTSASWSGSRSTDSAATTSSAVRCGPGPGELLDPRNAASSTPSIRRPRHAGASATCLDGPVGHVAGSHSSRSTSGAYGGCHPPSRAPRALARVAAAREALRRRSDPAPRRAGRRPPSGRVGRLAQPLDAELQARDRSTLQRERILGDPGLGLELARAGARPRRLEEAGADVVGLGVGVLAPRPAARTSAAPGSASLQQRERGADVGLGRAAPRTRPGAGRRRTARRRATAASRRAGATSRIERLDLRPGGLLPGGPRAALRRRAVRTGSVRRRGARAQLRAELLRRRPGRGRRASSGTRRARARSGGRAAPRRRRWPPGPVPRPSGGRRRRAPGRAGRRGTAWRRRARAATRRSGRPTPAAAPGSRWARSPGSEPGRQVGDADLELVALLPGGEAVGRALAGGVGVEGEHDPLGEPATAASRGPR